MGDFEKLFKLLGGYVFTVFNIRYRRWDRLQSLRLIFGVGCELAAACQPFGTSMPLFVERFV